MNKEYKAINKIREEFMLAEKFNRIKMNWEESYDVIIKLLDGLEKKKVKPVYNKDNGRVICGNCNSRIRDRVQENSNVGTYCDKCGVKVDWSDRFE